MCLIAFSAMGFGLFTAPVLGNLFLKQQYGLDAFRRGLIGTIGSLGVLVALPFVGRYYDKLYHRDPAQALALIGKMLLPVAVLVPIQYFMPDAVLWAVFSVMVTVLTLGAFSMVGPVLTSVAPYHLRGLTGAVGAIYLFFFGATGGAVLSAGLDQAFGPRAAVLIVMIPTTIIGGFLIIRGSRFIRNDLSLVVLELQEEQEEHQRQAADPESIPVLQLNNVDFSYGHVQVLFNVAFEVRRGEVLALLGTNGAGKSTALKVAAGLVTADRGVVRLNGRTVTYATPEQRSRLGIHLLPGGRGVFGEMTIYENLEMGGFAYRGDRAEMRRRMERVLAMFPALESARNRRADTLSGGQQQMLALAIALLHDPQVLMIDELSLGLAPIVVQELIEVVERLKAEGVTMIVVEQSLNVAAAIADRAVFMEKGQVRFEGAIADLMERDDLARAVFLGGEVTGLMLAVGWLNSQIVYDGVVQGLAIAVIAVGVVLVYRATRIINFAVGNIGVVGAVTLSLLVLQYGVPFWIALVIALIIGLVFGAAVEMTVIRRLKNAPRVVVLVATIGIAGLAQAISIEIPEPSDASAHYPSAFNGAWTIAGVSVRGADVSVLVLVPVAVLALIWFLDRTLIGKTVKACASNPSLARLSAISPKMVSTMVWALAAALSTLSVVLIAGESSTGRRPGDAGSADALRGPRRRGDRGDALVPRRGARRRGHRRDSERAHLQLPGRTRHHRPAALHRRVRGGRLRQAGG